MYHDRRRFGLWHGLRYKDEKEFTWYDIIHAYYVVWKVAKRTYQFDKAALLEREEITFTELKKIVKGDGDECVKIVGYTGTGLVEVQVLRKDCTLRLYRMQAEVFRHCGSRNCWRTTQNMCASP